MANIGGSADAYMDYGKYGDDHHQRGADSCGGGDRCGHDTRQEERKVILWLRVCGLCHEWGLSYQELKMDLAAHGLVLADCRW